MEEGPHRDALVRPAEAGQTAERRLQAEEAAVDEAPYQRHDELLRHGPDGRAQGPFDG